VTFDGKLKQGFYFKTNLQKIGASTLDNGTLSLAINNTISFSKTFVENHFVTSNITIKKYKNIAMGWVEPFFIGCLFISSFSFFQSIQFFQSC